MTLIVVVRYDEGIAIASDSRAVYTDTPLMREEAPKIETLGRFVITGAGLAGPLDRIINEIKNSFRSSPSLSYDDLLGACEDSVWAFYQKYGERIQEENEEEDWTILLASEDRMCRIMSTGWSEEEYRYTIEGSGGLYAEYILNQRYRRNITEKEAKELVVHTVNQTSKIDPNVGGKINQITISKGSVRRASDDEVEEILAGLVEGESSIEKETQKIVHEIVDKRRWINAAFNEKIGFELFDQNEFAVSEIQKRCRSETDFTTRISALALLIDGMKCSDLKRQISTQPDPGSVNALEAFLKERYPTFNPNLTANLRDIMTLRSKKMPIHEDHPKIVQVILKWEYKIPPNWASLWRHALMKYKESLLHLEAILSS